MAAIDKSQEVIDGRVLARSSTRAARTRSPARARSSLYDQELASMDIEGGFDQQDSEGFIKINAIRLMAHNAIMRRKHKHWGVDP